MNPLCLICCRIRADTVLLACWSRTQEHYSAKEAARYTGAAASVQKDLTERSLAIAGLLPSLSSPKLLLDIGCGSGLSGKVSGWAQMTHRHRSSQSAALRRLWCARDCLQVVSDAGYHWIGVDISADMLALAEQSSRAHAPGRKVAAAAGEGSSARAQRRGLCCGLALADMGRSLGVGRHSSTLSRTDQAGNQPRSVCCLLRTKSRLPETMLKRPVKVRVWITALLLLQTLTLGCLTVP